MRQYVYRRKHRRVHHLYVHTRSYNMHMKVTTCVYTLLACRYIALHRTPVVHILSFAGVCFIHKAKYNQVVQWQRTQTPSLHARRPHEKQLVLKALRLLLRLGFRQVLAHGLWLQYSAEAGNWLLRVIRILAPPPFNFSVHLEPIQIRRSEIARGCEIMEMLLSRCWRHCWLRAAKSSRVRGLHTSCWRSSRALQGETVRVGCSSGFWGDTSTAGGHCLELLPHSVSPEEHLAFNCSCWMVIHRHTRANTYTNTIVSWGWCFLLP